MKKLKGKVKAVSSAAALGFACIFVINGTTPVSSAENMPIFDNQGRKIYHALEKTPGTNLAADSWGRTLADFYKLRQYPGSPPRIPHEVDLSFSGKETDCLSCHEQGGFSPFEALRGATIDGARYFGMDAEIGSIEPGKLADLVVIDGNPLENIRDSQNVVYTMLNGRLYDASNMNQVAPKQVEREPFFFERQGGDAWIPATHERFERQAQALGWRHEH